MTTIRKWIASLMAVVLCVSMLAVPAGAYSRVDTDQPVKLTLTYKNEKTPVEGMTLELYQVYDMSDAVRFTPTEEFKAAYEDEFHFNIYDPYWQVTNGDGTVAENQVNWKLMTSTLEGLILRDKADEKVDPPKPVETLTTDANGQVFFGKDGNLKPGLYLVMGEAYEVGRYTYIPQTFLVALPHLLENDTWQYEVNADGKMQTDYDPPASTTSYTVVKEWEIPEESEVEQPNSVTVQLLHNGEVYDETTLSEENNWQHTWNRLSRHGTWQVVEVDVPEGFTVSVDQTGKTFTVTNTADEDIDEPDTPLDPGPGDGDGDGDGTDPGGDPDVPPVDIEDPDVPGTGLPQTGTLWWPVQVLTIAGILLFSLGWLDLRRKKNHE
mgnify:CR=1 FL=1